MDRPFVGRIWTLPPTWVPTGGAPVSDPAVPAQDRAKCCRAGGRGSGGSVQMRPLSSGSWFGCAIVRSRKLPVADAVGHLPAAAPQLINRSSPKRIRARGAGGRACTPLVNARVQSIHAGTPAHGDGTSNDLFFQFPDFPFEHGRDAVFGHINL